MCVLPRRDVYTFVYQLSGAGVLHMRKLLSSLQQSQEPAAVVSPSFMQRERV